MAEQIPFNPEDPRWKEYIDIGNELYDNYRYNSGTDRYETGISENIGTRSKKSRLKDIGAQIIDDVSLGGFRRGLGHHMRSGATNANMLLSDPNLYDQTNPWVRLGKGINERTIGLGELISYPVDTFKEIGTGVKEVVVPNVLNYGNRLIHHPIDTLKGTKQDIVDYYTDPYNDPMKPLDIASGAAGVVEGAGALTGFINNAKKLIPKRSVPKNSVQIDPRLTSEIMEVPEIKFPSEGSMGGDTVKGINPTPKPSMGGDTIKGKVETPKNYKDTNLNDFLAEEKPINTSETTTPDKYIDSSVNEFLTEDKLFKNGENTILPKVNEIIDPANEPILSKDSYINRYDQKFDEIFGKYGSDDVLGKYKAEITPEENVENLITAMGSSESSPTFYNTRALDYMINQIALNTGKSPNEVITDLRNIMKGDPNLKDREGFLGYFAQGSRVDKVPDEIVIDTKPRLRNNTFKDADTLKDIDSAPTPYTSSLHEILHWLNSQKDYADLRLKGVPTTHLDRYNEKFGFPSKRNEGSTYGLDAVGLPDNIVIDDRIKNGYSPAADLTDANIVKNKKLFEQEIKRYDTLKQLGVIPDDYSSLSQEVINNIIDPNYINPYNYNFWRL